MSEQELPRGIRNNNPGNIEWGEPWQGLDELRPDRDQRFAQFISPEDGIRALAKTLQTYQKKHGINTIEGIISRWAPTNENRTGNYIDDVAKRTGFAPHQKLDMNKEEHLRPVLEAIICHENGKGNKNTLNTWYDDKTIKNGLERAGVFKTVPERGRNETSVEKEALPVGENKEQAASVPISSRKPTRIAPVTLPEDGPVPEQKPTSQRKVTAGHSVLLPQNIPIPAQKPFIQKAAVPSGTVSAASLTTDLRQFQKEMGVAFRKNPKQALEEYPGNENVLAANAVLDGLKEKGGRFRASVPQMRGYLANRIERGQRIPTPQEAMKMVHSALLDRGR